MKRCRPKNDFSKKISNKTKWTLSSNPARFQWQEYRGIFTAHVIGDGLKDGYCSATQGLSGETQGDDIPRFGPSLVEVMTYSC
jgi:hypothetical protein